MEYVILLLMGLLAGTIGSLVGLGGGVVIVPGLLFLGASGILAEATPQIAAGTSLLVIIFTGLSSSIAYYKQGKVDIHTGLLLFIGGGPGGIIGAWVNKQLNANSFSLGFGLFMIFISIVLMYKDKIPPLKKKGEKGIWRTFTDSEGNEYTYGFQPIIAISIAFVVGFLGGLLGIGGGALLVPSLILLFHFPVHIAVATSMLLLFFTSITSSITYIALGHVDWLYAFMLIPGAWLGGTLGAKINQKLPSKTIVIFLRIMLILVGIRLIMDSFI